MRPREEDSYLLQDYGGSRVRLYPTPLPWMYARYPF